MSGSILVYGATGFTAGLVIDAMLASGLRPILSARNSTAVRALGERLHLPFRPASIDDRGSLVHALDGVSVMLNLAGPFSDTAGPAAAACLDAGAHYLDVSGEVDAIQTIANLHSAARARGLMLMAGVGFDVVPSDCLCAHVARRSADVRALRVAIAGLDLVSPGSLKTLLRELGRETRVHRAGALREVSPEHSFRSFDFGGGPRPCAAVTWGDLVTAPITTGASEVQTYFELTPAVAGVVQANRHFGWAYRLPWVQEALTRMTPRNLGGPTAEQMARRRASIVAEAEDSAGRRVASRLTTPESYTLTAATANDIARRVLGGDYEPGFQTPGRVFGPEFILRFAGVTRMDLEGSA